MKSKLEPRRAFNPTRFWPWRVGRRPPRSTDRVRPERQNLLSSVQTWLLGHLGSLSMRVAGGQSGRAIRLPSCCMRYRRRVLAENSIPPRISNSGSPGPGKMGGLVRPLQPTPRPRAASGRKSLVASSSTSSPRSQKSPVFQEPGFPDVLKRLCSDCRSRRCRPVSEHSRRVPRRVARRDDDIGRRPCGSTQGSEPRIPLDDRTSGSDLGYMGCRRCYVRMDSTLATGRGMAFGLETRQRVLHL